MKKYIKYFVLALFVFLISNKVYANSINSIKMDIYIDKNGDAHITEVWDSKLTRGTEGYRYYGNLGNSTITNYSVKDENTIYTPYSSDNEWNINASFNEKAYKYGINYSNGHQELCFGISSYGKHVYTLNYTITGFVGKTSDSQVLYWELIPNDLAKLTDNIYIKIYSDEKWNDDLDVWGYGNYGGYAYVYDGYIEISNNNLKNDEYVTVLVKFDQDTFNTNNIIGNDFNYFYNKAEFGAKHYKDDNSTINIILCVVLFFITIIISGIMFKTFTEFEYVGNTKLDYGNKTKRIPNDVPMFRDLPCNKDIFEAYFIAISYNLMKKKTDFLGAILLKWLKENKIRIESKTVGKIFKKEDTTIIFDSPNIEFQNELETRLYGYMYKASRDGILESNEFQKWCNSNYSTILNWFDKILNYESDILVSNGLLVKEEITRFKFFKSSVYKVTDRFYQEAVKLKGLKMFFNEFDNMSDKEAIDVHLWQEYLMFAQILGVADKVAKQFKKLYPDVITDYSYDTVIFLNTMANTGMITASKARDRARSYNSGGGGFSSGGGGVGSFGSGGGGGFR